MSKRFFSDIVGNVLALNPPTPVNKEKVEWAGGTELIPLGTFEMNNECHRSNILFQGREVVLPTDLYQGTPPPL